MPRYQTLYGQNRLDDLLNLQRFLNAGQRERWIGRRGPVAERRQLVQLPFQDQRPRLFQRQRVRVLFPVTGIVQALSARPAPSLPVRTQRFISLSAVSPTAPVTRTGTPPAVRSAVIAISLLSPSG